MFLWLSSSFSFHDIQAPSPRLGSPPTGPPPGHKRFYFLHRRDEKGRRIVIGVDIRYIYYPSFVYPSERREDYRGREKTNGDGGFFFFFLLLALYDLSLCLGFVREI